jgi:hypothetical protein
VQELGRRLFEFVLQDKRGYAVRSIQATDNGHNGYSFIQWQMGW